MEAIIETEEGCGGRNAPDEMTAEFRANLQKLDVTQSGLAERMSQLGDHRPFATILRSIQRMASGEARVSGEMQVIVELLLRERRRAIQAWQQVSWNRDERGNVCSEYGDFRIILSPQTRSRWRVSLIHKDGYSPPWPRWQDSLDAAKLKALVCLEEAIDHLELSRAEASGGATRVAGIR